LHIFGDGVLRVPLERQAAKELPPAHVHYQFHGAVDTPGEALKQIDLLVLPSVAEGFGLVLIEAMATGVPVIATDVPGIRDVVDHERTGLLVPRSAGIELAFGIMRLIEETSLRRRLIENGLREVRERFSWESVMRKYRQVLGIAEKP